MSVHAIRALIVWRTFFGSCHNYCVSLWKRTMSLLSFVLKSMYPEEDQNVFLLNLHHGATLQRTVEATVDLHYKAVWLIQLFGNVNRFRIFPSSSEEPPVARSPNNGVGSGGNKGTCHGLFPPLLLKRRCSRDRTKMQRSSCSTYFNEKRKREHSTPQNKNNKRGKTETVLSGAENTETGNNNPQNTQRTWLPKYGSHSETCPEATIAVTAFFLGRRGGPKRSVVEVHGSLIRDT